MSYGYSVMRGKRAGMEDFFYAEVGLAAPETPNATSHTLIGLR